MFVAGFHAKPPTAFRGHNLFKNKQMRKRTTAYFYHLLSSFLLREGSPETGTRYAVSGDANEFYAAFLFGIPVDDGTAFAGAN